MPEKAVIFKRSLGLRFILNPELLFFRGELCLKRKIIINFLYGTGQESQQCVSN